MRDAAGNFYGTTDLGGKFGGICGENPAGGCGVVFKVDRSGTETPLYTFTGGADGWQPFSGVIRDAAGNLYGTAGKGGVTGGICGIFGCGLVYKIDPNGKETVLYAFTGRGDGFAPTTGLIADTAGNLYGTTWGGGMAVKSCAIDKGCGVIFRLDPSGRETVLYRFTGGLDGSNPDVALIRDAQGNLYGSTFSGGASSLGTIFKLDRTRKLTVLSNFGDGLDGALGLTMDSVGNLYGAAAEGPNGGVFKVDTQGNFSVLHTFLGPDGSDPSSGLVSDSDGNLYGTTLFGGDSGCFYGSGCGVVYKITP